MLAGIREDGHPAERLTETFDAARGDIDLWSGARSQDRDQTVANRGWSCEAPSLDRRSLCAQKANCVDFGSGPTASPRLGHRSTRRMHDLILAQPLLIIFQSRRSGLI